jgi:16S rRNA processing protein RimM
MIRDADSSPFTQIGHISRTHGLQGELKIEFEPGNLQDVQNLKMVYLRNNRGDYYPCRIASVRIEGKGNRNSFFVQFEHIADRNAAEALRAKAIFLETELATLFLPTEKGDEGCLDFEVTDELGNYVGLVTDEFDNGAQLVLSITTTKGTLLVPVVKQFVQSIDESSKTVRCCNLQLLQEEE